MKANLRLRPAAAAFVLGAALATTVSCSEQRVEPTPAPTATPAQPPAPRPLPTPSVDWRDAPITPGVWEWRMRDGDSVASFADGLLIMQCDSANRIVRISRRGSAAGVTAMRIVTSFVTRQMNAAPQAGASPVLSFSVNADDRLLDAMAFSRGRFAVETAGMPTLYVPSWPEVSRVIEDCR